MTTHFADDATLEHIRTLESKLADSEEARKKAEQLASNLSFDILSIKKDLFQAEQRSKAAEEALKPKPPRDGIYSWAIALEPTSRHAQYWVEGGRNEPDRAKAIMCVEQGVNSWKNACYAYAEKLEAAERENAELKRKLAEQQAQEKKMRSVLVLCHSKLAGCTSTPAIPAIEDALETVGEATELNKLLSEAKQEGYKECNNELAGVEAVGWVFEAQQGDYCGLLSSRDGARQIALIPRPDPM